MIKSLVIKNFKAIRRLEIAFTPFTVLIGGNSCGKSTVLQALDFARAFTTRDIDEYLHERGWAFDDLKSQFEKKGISIGLELLLSINGKLQNIYYSFVVDICNGEFVTNELIENRSENKILLERNEFRPSSPGDIDRFLLKSSFLKLIDENNPSEKFDAGLYAVKKFFARSSSYELLMPDRMREKGSRGEVKNIGMGGEKLAAYINKMSVSQRSKLNKILSDFMGYTAKTTTEMTRPGWVDLFLNESFSEVTTKIKAAHISDGLLRLIALIAASLPENNHKQKNLLFDIPDSGFILLDEIEDGINPYLTEKVVDMLRKAVEVSGKQVIITTHSPVMLNRFQQNEIVFMWRDGEGNIHAKPMFATEDMKDTLDCFNPGEVWLNYGKDEILAMMESARLGGLK